MPPDVATLNIVDITEKVPTRPTIVTKTIISQNYNEIDNSKTRLSSRYFLIGGYEHTGGVC